MYFSNYQNVCFTDTSTDISYGGKTTYKNLRKLNQFLAFRWRLITRLWHLINILFHFQWHNRRHLNNRPFSFYNLYTTSLCMICKFKISDRDWNSPSSFACKKSHYNTMRFLSSSWCITLWKNPFDLNWGSISLQLGWQWFNSNKDIIPRSGDNNIDLLLKFKRGMNNRLFNLIKLFIVLTLIILGE